MIASAEPHRTAGHAPSHRKSNQLFIPCSERRLGGSSIVGSRRGQPLNPASRDVGGIEIALDRRAARLPLRPQAAQRFEQVRPIVVRTWLGTRRLGRQVGLAVPEPPQPLLHEIEVLKIVQVRLDRLTRVGRSWCAASAPPARRAAVRCRCSA